MNTDHELSNQWRNFRAWGLGLAAAALLAGCGGNEPDWCSPGTAGCDSTIGTGGPIYDNTGPAPASNTVAGICTADGEKQFVRSYLTEQYLWYKDLKPLNPAAAADVSEYFYGILADTPDRLGRPKDRFSFIVPTSTADALSTGANVGYGVEWKGDTAGRQRVAQVTVGSPAAQAGMARGGELVSVFSATDRSWYPNRMGATVTFKYRDTPTAPIRDITLQAVAVQDDPLPTTRVIDVEGGRKVGYMLFNDHSSVAQDKLIDAVQSMKGSGINDLVLDMRYNGGGYLYVALSMASMVAGPGADGKVFEQLVFNDKRAQDTAESKLPFVQTVLVADSNRHPEGSALPMLSLPRVYVLTSDSTCSASESIINGLRGVDVNVVLIGSTTCGKPYGFSRKDNCGMSLYPIEFQGANAKGFGDYAEGLVANCTVADDFDHALGDTGERMLSAALQHVRTGVCPTASASEGARATPLPIPGPAMTGKPQLGRVLSGAFR